MYRPSRKGTSRKNFVTSFLLLVVLIGSSISSIGIMGITISPQEAWGSHAAPPAMLSPTNELVINDNTPNLDWANAAGATSYSVQVDNNNDFSSITYSAT